MLDDKFFASINGLSWSLNYEFLNNFNKLTKVLEDTETLSIGAGASSKGFEDFALTIKKVDESYRAKYRDLINAACLVKDIYNEVTNAHITAVPGTDNGHGMVMMIE